MASPFSRTVRSVAADHFVVSLTGLLLACVLAVIWGHWFFTARVAFYETSDRVRVTGDETVVSAFPANAGGGTQRAVRMRARRILAAFPVDARERIAVGQPASLTLNTPAGQQAGVVRAQVERLSVDEARQLLLVELTATVGADRPNPFEEGADGELRIESRYVTPAELVMQASGLFTDAPPVTFGPQPAP